MGYKYITKVNGPVIVASGDVDFSMHDIVLVGNLKLLGEVINLNGQDAIIQVYEDTSGLKIGEKVEGTNAPLSLTLAPGMIGNVFDGIQRPLPILKSIEGDFISRGLNISSIDTEKKWKYTPIARIGDKIRKGSFIGEVKETASIVNKIMYPNDKEVEIIEIVKEGEYTVNDTIAKVKDSEGNIENINMIQKWPVRVQRGYKERIVSNEPLITGQRIIDSVFPIAKGGTAAIPGGFGTGKTVLQHQLAKWSDADIIVYIGCGERGNEMTEVLEDFPKLLDPRTHRPLMERTVLIANTSNMPVAAREASIYTGITIAEYYRDMGYNVAVMADSTSRWAEALREISARLEEMPAEEGFPSYLPSRLSEFYGRAGMVENYNDTTGSITIIGAVSPQGGDFSEPVTQNTKRFIHVFWALDRDLAYQRHYPAVNWMISYSEYAQRLEDWYLDNISLDFYEYRKKIIELLGEENSLLEISKVVGKDVLQDNKKLILRACQSIRSGFLAQNSMDEIDTYVPLEKQYRMMQTIIKLYDNASKLIDKGIPISEINELGYFDEYSKLKYNIKNDELYKFDEIDEKYKIGLKRLEDEYKYHL